MTRSSARPADGLLDGSLDNTWVITGGAAPAGDLARLGGMRGYVGHFEESIRWVNGSDSVAGRQRFVINTGRAGQTLTDVLNGFDRRVAAYDPRAVAFFVGSGENGDTFSKDLEVFIGKCLALREGRGFAVIQYLGGCPFANAIRAVETTLRTADPGGCPRLIVVEHTGIAVPDTALTETDHQRIARQLSLAVIGSGDIGEPWSLTAEKAPVFYDTGAAPAVRHTGTGVLTVTVPREGRWKFLLRLCGGGELVTGVLAGGRAKDIPGLPEGADFTLITRSMDGTVQLRTVTGRVSEAGAAPAPALGPVQRKIAGLMRSDRQLTWLFMGDSITHGALHTHYYDSVPQLFEKYLHSVAGREEDVVVNTAVSGANSGRGLNRDTHENEGTLTYLSSRLTAYRSARPDVVFLMLGTNDPYVVSPISAQEYADNIAAIISQARRINENAVIILRSPTACRDRPEAGAVYGPVLDAIAEENSGFCLYVDQYTRMARALQDYEWLNAGPCPPLYGDGIHPGPEGHLIMFKHLLWDMGLWSWDNPLADLRYAFDLPREHAGPAPDIVRQGGSLTLDAAGLERSFGRRLGRVSLTAADTAAQLCYTTRAGAKDGLLRLEALPPGEYAVKVSAVLADSAKIVTFQERTLLID